MASAWRAVRVPTRQDLWSLALAEPAVLADDLADLDDVQVGDQEHHWRAGIVAPSPRGGAG
jgi:hypothetical protein